MGYYDPSNWIAPDDSLIGEVEDRLKLDKRAQPKATRVQPRAVRAGKAFLPPNSFELDVIIESTKEVLRLVEWMDKEGKVFIELGVSVDFLRIGHFNHGWHHNPNGRNIPPPHHIHFPTFQYRNITRPPTYAYPVQSGSDFVEAFQTFCDNANIRIKGVPLPLLRR